MSKSYSWLSHATNNSNQSTHHFKFYNQSWDAKKIGSHYKVKIFILFKWSHMPPHFELLSNLYLLMNCEHIVKTYYNTCFAITYTKQIHVYDEGECLPPMMACKSQACNDGPKSFSTRSLLKIQKKLFPRGHSSLFDHTTPMVRNHACKFPCNMAHP